MEDDLDRLLVEVNAAIATVASRIGPDARPVLDAFPSPRGPDGRLLFVPRLALLATLWEHPGAVRPPREQVDEWERRYLAFIDAKADSDEERGAPITARQVVMISFDVARARLG